LSSIIDRRKNPKGKNLGNRQKFLRRSKEYIKEAVKEAIQKRTISDIESDEKIKIPIKGITEPIFRESFKKGSRNIVLPGNKEFIKGDKIKKPSSDDQGNNGPNVSTDDDISEDDFQFTLTKEEFLDFFFDDLELPDLIKTSLKDVVKYKSKRAGFTSVGNPSNLNITRTFKKSLARRIALKRPKRSILKKLQKELDALLKKINPSEETLNKIEKIKKLIIKYNKKIKTVPFIDPVDLKYTLFTKQPDPNTKAVMICIMDVSGSMGPTEKDLSKRFFMLLYMFLKKQYEKIDLIFIRHHTQAKECTEEEFFYSKETGGTIVSSSLLLANKIILERYPTSDWNIYIAQCSDGDSTKDDAAECSSILLDKLLPLIQYFAYIEIYDHKSNFELWAQFIGSKHLWKAYSTVEKYSKKFKIKRITDITDIFKVFKELFEKRV